MDRLFRLTILLAAMFVLAVILALNTGERAGVALAAVDCTETNVLRIEVIDLDADDSGTRIDVPGAFVRFNPDPDDGLGTRTVTDNGPDDESPLLGRIEWRTACAGEYVVWLGFSDSVGACDFVNPSATPNTSRAELTGDTSEGDDTVTFEVDDCAAAPAPTPTPTSTPTVTPTATATPAPTNTPVPTATPAPTATPQPPIIVVVAAPTAVPTASKPASAVITPPNTGNAGLAARGLQARPILAGWGDENDYHQGCRYYFNGWGWWSCWNGWW